MCVFSSANEVGRLGRNVVWLLRYYLCGHTHTHTRTHAHTVSILPVTKGVMRKNGDSLHVGEAR